MGELDAEKQVYVCNSSLNSQFALLLSFSQIQNDTSYHYCQTDFFQVFLNSGSKKLQ